MKTVRSNQIVNLTERGNFPTGSSRIFFMFIFFRSLVSVCISESHFIYKVTFSIKCDRHVRMGDIVGLCHKVTPVSVFINRW